MKKGVFLLLLFISAKSSTAQIAGNSVYAGENSYENFSRDAGVDLSLRNSSYTYATSFEANTMMNVKATAYVAIFSLSQFAKTTEEAETLLSNRIAVFTQALASENIAQDAVFIDPVSMVPTYEFEVANKKFSKTLTEVPSGFEIKKNVHITFKNQSQVNAIIAIAARAEVYDLVKVEYVVEDRAAVLDKLRQEALKILLAKKAAMEAAGLHLRFTNIGEVHGTATPPERYAQYYAYKTGASPSYIINYKKGQPQQEVAYNYAEKNKTIYYNKVSDKQFDLVLNSTVSEPEVQIYYSLKATYTLYDAEQETINKEHNVKMLAYQEKEAELRLKALKKDIELKGKITPVLKKEK